MGTFIDADTAKLAGLQMDILGKIRNGRLTLDHLEKFSKGQDPFITDTFVDWRKFYGQYLGIEVSRMKMWEPEADFNRLVVMPRCLNYENTFEACKKNFPCRLLDFDFKDITWDDRDLGRNVDSYTIWVRNHKEADKVHRNKSAKKLKEERISGVTLLERMILELKYFDQTGLHLDTESMTLCSGSFCKTNTPVAYWENDVFWISSLPNPETKGERLGTREVIC